MFFKLFFEYEQDKKKCGPWASCTKKPIEYRVIHHGYSQGCQKKGRNFKFDNLGQKNLSKPENLNSFYM